MYINFKENSVWTYDMLRAALTVLLGKPRGGFLGYGQLYWRNGNDPPTFYGYITLYKKYPASVYVDPVVNRKIAAILLQWSKE